MVDLKKYQPRNSNGEYDSYPTIIKLAKWVIDTCLKKGNSKT